MVQRFFQLQNPLRTVVPFQEQFSVFILSYFNKAVIVVEEVRLVTIRQNIRHILPAAGKTPQHIFPACIMPTMGNTVLNTLQALLDAVKANIEKPDGVSSLLRLLRRQCRLAV